jgi:hypothetical protein
MYILSNQSGRTFWTRLGAQANRSALARKEGTLGWPESTTILSHSVRSNYP